MTSSGIESQSSHTCGTRIQGPYEVGSAPDFVGSEVAELNTGCSTLPSIEESLADIPAGDGVCVPFADVQTPEIFAELYRSDFRDHDGAPSGHWEVGLRVQGLSASGIPDLIGVLNGFTEALERLDEPRLAALCESIPNPRWSQNVQCQAIGLWTLACSWCASHDTELIPIELVDQLGTSMEIARLLLAAGVWELANGGFRSSSLIVGEVSAMVNQTIETCTSECER